MNETSCEEYITCPHCGYEDRDSWDYDFGSSDCLEVECGSCESHIMVTKHVSISYSARLLRVEGGA